MVTAREATPGTKVIVTGTWLGTPASGSRIETVHSTVIVGRWEGNGDGMAYLFSDKGQCCGLYAADALLATTLGESFAQEASR